jgi:WD40 repeat protein
MGPNKDIIVCGDDYGLVQIFRSPARKGCHPISLRGHAEHVVRVMFVGDDLVSIGGQDKTVFHWT